LTLRAAQRDLFGRKGQAKHGRYMFEQAGSRAWAADGGAAIGAGGRGWLRGSHRGGLAERKRCGQRSRT